MPIVPISSQSADPTSPMTSASAPHARLELRVLEHLQAEARKGRKLLEADRDEPRRIGRHQIKRDARLHPRDRRVTELTEVHLLAIEPHRQNQRRLLIEEPEGVGQDADDLARLAVDHDAPADHGRIAAEPRAPVTTRQHHGVLSAG
jgi:hypothetical protein